jgi:hypothetical protein
MLGKILCCTLVVPRLAATLEAWRHWLDYRLIGKGYVSAAQAKVWGAEAMAGRPTAVLVAASGEPPYLRLIEGSAPEGYAPLRTFGWNAIELRVSDPYALARDLRDSPFRVVVPPRPLPFDPRLHAMQVIGPGGELLYCTRIPDIDPPFGLRAAGGRVDAPFIAILGGAAVEPLLAYYRQTFGNDTVAASPTVIRIVNETFGLPPDHATPMGIVRLAPGFLLELDGCPAGAGPRPRHAGELPPGLGLVSFEVAPRAWPQAGWRGEPGTALFELPYDGARVGVAEGAAGEWLELVEGTDD